MILAIPGFLGLPLDWDFLQLNNLRGVDWQSFSLNSFSEWTSEYLEWVSLQELKPNRILMGYSLGGRLALHALIAKPELWTGAIIISAHVGLANVQEKEKRYEKDKDWANRFETEDWTTLMESWESQDVFQSDTFQFKRDEKQYQRTKLARALTNLSLSKQENLYDSIQTLPIPILWVTGVKDEKYSKLAQNVIFVDPRSKCVQIANAGHRAPWTQPHLFSQTVKAFLKEIVMSE